MPLERKLSVLVRGHDSIVEILLLEDGIPVDSTGVERCEIVFKRPGSADVTISSADSGQGSWFDFEYPLIINGEARTVIRANFRDLSDPPANGRWQCHVFIWDLEHISGRLWGYYDVEIRGDPVLILTSHPYSLELLEGLDIGGVVLPGAFWPVLLEGLDIGGMVLSGGALAQPLLSYDHYEPEALDIGGMVLSGGALRVALLSYDHYEPEVLEIDGEILDGGALRVALFTYAFEPEALDITGQILSGGSLT
jgi:hypothetical protein